ncbi:hypothetical protein IAU60_001935 [Kwoniella sp. DSM 27419]
MAATLQNVYYERKTGTPRPCYICHRPTQTVLATLTTDDFVYTCEGHLSDPASPIAPVIPPVATPSPEDIKRVVSEYQAREARKKGKEDDKGGGSKKGGSEDGGSKEGKGSASPAPTPTPTAAATSPPSAAAPTHKKYQLHRHIFEMRRAEQRKKEQGVKAREVSRGLPQVPRTGF